LVIFATLLAEALFQFETAVEIMYKKPAKHSTQVAVAANVKTFLTTMMKYDLGTFYTRT